MVDIRSIGAASIINESRNCLGLWNTSYDLVETPLSDLSIALFAPLPLFFTLVINHGCNGTPYYIPKT